MRQTFPWQHATYRRDQTIRIRSHRAAFWHPPRTPESNAREQKPVLRTKLDLPGLAQAERTVTPRRRARVRITGLPPEGPLETTMPLAACSRRAQHGPPSRFRPILRLPRRGFQPQRLCQVSFGVPPRRGEQRNRLGPQAGTVPRLLHRGLASLSALVLN